VRQGNGIKVDGVGVPVAQGDIMAGGLATNERASWLEFDELRVEI